MPQEDGTSAYFTWGGEWENLKNKLRLEYNPNKLSKQLMLFLRFLREENIVKINQRLGKGLKVTRLDWAIDIPVHISEMKYKSKNGIRRIQYWKEGGDIESQYFGSRESERLIRVYDKAREQKEPGIKTRVECQSRKEFELHKPMAFYNPFKDFYIYVKNGLEFMPEEIPIEYKALIHYVEQYPEEYKKLGRKKKEKYEMYREMMFGFNYKQYDFLPILQRDYEKCIKGLQKDLGVI